MTISIGVVGAGLFSGSFAKLFKLHPGVGKVTVTDLIRERADALNDGLSLDGVFESFDDMLASDVDAVAIFTQRWTHAPLVKAALRAGKNVYSAVPMAISEADIQEIVREVERTRLIYMMGETSFYNPATVFARKKRAEGAFGRVFYAEGDYVHDMDLGFYDAYKSSGGVDWRKVASFPPMLYPTHSLGGVLGALDAHVVSVSALGVRDQEQEHDGSVFDKDTSQWDNDFSNASALFELSDGGVVRTNEMRRVGYPAHIRESRFRFFGTLASFEQLATISLWQDKETVEDVSALLRTQGSLAEDDPSLANVAPALRAAFVSGAAEIHDVSRLPASFVGAPNGHEGTHHFLVDDFVKAVASGKLPPVNAWVAARYTLPGVIAHESALQAGARLVVDDLGAPPSDWERLFPGSPD